MFNFSPSMGFMSKFLPRQDNPGMGMPQMGTGPANPEYGGGGMPELPPPPMFDAGPSPNMVPPGMSKPGMPGDRSMGMPRMMDGPANPMMGGGGLMQMLRSRMQQPSTGATNPGGPVGSGMPQGKGPGMMSRFANMSATAAPEFAKQLTARKPKLTY